MQSIVWLTKNHGIYGYLALLCKVLCRVLCRVCDDGRVKGRVLYSAFMMQGGRTVEYCAEYCAEYYAEYVMTDD